MTLKDHVIVVVAVLAMSVIMDALGFVDDGPQAEGASLQDGAEW